MHVNERISLNYLSLSAPSFVSYHVSAKLHRLLRKLILVVIDSSYMNGPFAGMTHEIN
jgi:hypothetical protein